MPRYRKWVVAHEDEEWRNDSLTDKNTYDNMFSSYASNIHEMKEKYVTFMDLFRKFDIYTTRFNSHTYMLNQRYKENHEISGSLYSTMLPFPKNTIDEKYLFILDMNNTTNQIMGIGFLKNCLAKDQNLHIYDDPAFNNYIYKSLFYISIHENTEFESSWNEFIETEFNRRLFYGKTHLKRGGSFSRFPMKTMKSIHLKFLLSLFVILNPNQFNNIVNY